MMVAPRPRYRPWMPWVWTSSRAICMADTGRGEAHVVGAGQHGVGGDQLRRAQDARTPLGGWKNKKKKGKECIPFNDETGMVEKGNV